ncbi:MAG: T9SS type A sorting domain-containing protein [candidate division Zixibacteria bacterium]|nr:T9SS type A sorting domain-containing protein [candidate division Zixibacteria bacterium]
MKTLGVILAMAFALLTSVVSAQEHVSSIHLGSRYEKIVERNGYWYLVGQWGLECWRFDEHKQFVKLSEVPTPGIAQWVALEGNYAYVADGWEGLTIVDVSNPHNLRFVSNFMPTPISFGALPGYFEHVAVKDHIVYLTGRYGIAVIDATAPQTPVQIDRIYYADTLYGVFMDEGNRVGMVVFHDSTMYVAYTGTPNWEKYPPGIYQYDISDPRDIRLERTYGDLPCAGKFLAIQDSALFVAGIWAMKAFRIASDSLIAKDSITDMTMITQLGDPEDISLSGNTLLLAGTGGKTSGGIANINVANLDSIYYVEIYETPVHFNCAAIADSTAIAGYFHYDLLLLDLMPDGTLDSTDFVKSAGNIQGLSLYADHLFVGDLSNGVLIYDVTDRVYPSLVSRIPIKSPISPTVLDGYLFVGSIGSGTMVYDVQSPADPVLTDSLPDSKRSGFCKWGDLIFMGTNDGVDIFDFSTAKLRFVGFSTAGGGHEMIIRDSILFSPGGAAKINSDTTLTFLSRIGSTMTGFDLVDSFYFASRGYFGLHIFNVANPSIPLYVTRWDTFTYANPPGDGRDVRVLGTTALLLDGDWGITEIDVANPLQPQFIKRITTPSSANGMCYDDRYFYVADFLGVEIFSYDFSTDTEVVDPPLPRSFTLYQNYPNPFNSQTVIAYDLPKPSDVDLSIFNSLGQRVKTLRVDAQTEGIHSYNWDGTSNSGKEVASGIYFYRLSANNINSTKKMILLR